jgi:hypothetical protein
VSQESIDSMSECRNCGSNNLVELGFIGLVAPFFLKRVFNMELNVPVSPYPIKQLIRTLGKPLNFFFSRVYPEKAFIGMQICSRCSFVQARDPFPEDWITRLYLDYRSETYNTERIRYEPTYKDIAARVGTDEVEVAHRLEAATLFLSDKLERSPEFTMLDYGGADGRFLPNLSERRFVYEISDVAPIPGIERIASEDSLGQYSYVHLAHVLEHVVHPLKLVKHVTEFLEPRGYLYIEVPQEITDANLLRLQHGATDIAVGIHEHINSYSPAALTHLMNEVGLDVIAIEATPVDVGWATAVHLRALGRKSS